ncbi:MAG: hypothetical protein ACAI25_11595, partial [Planctomycetota bacterium]
NTAFIIDLREPSPDDTGSFAPVKLSVGGRKPHTWPFEAADEVGALVERFGLVLGDCDLGEGAFTKERFIEVFASFNRAAHQVAIQFAGQSSRVLPRGKLEAAWRWNRGQRALAESSGEGIFVPKILFGAGKKADRVETFVAWVEGIPARVPEVDAIQGALGRVSWSAISEALLLAKRVESPVPHWLFEGEAVKLVARALERGAKGPPPAILSPREVYTADIVAEYAPPPKKKPPRRKK